MNDKAIAEMVQQLSTPRQRIYSAKRFNKQHSNCKSKGSSMDRAPNDTIFEKTKTFRKLPIIVKFCAGPYILLNF